VKILLLAHAFNGLAQRLFVELAARGHELAIALDVNDAATREAMARERPDVVLAPFLKRAIPADVWSSAPCLVVHPGVPGDRGPSALDWAILEGEREWGVTVLQAEAEMDAGPVWAHRAFPMRFAAKSSLYRREVTEAALAATLEAIEKLQRGETPTPASLLGAAARGRARPPMKQADRAIDWSRHTTLEVLRRIHCADGFPGVRDRLFGRDVYLHGAHEEDGIRGGSPGDVIAVRDGAILRSTLDGAVWITHLRPAGDGEDAIKRPAEEVLGEALAGVPRRDVAVDAAQGGTWREIRYEERGPVGILHFAFHNGAMSTRQCERLLEALRFARGRRTRVLVLAGGPDFWSNGIHLHAIEAAERPADASWENINAIDDVAREIVTDTDRLTISAVAGGAGAGGVFLALAADRVWLREGVVLNPHYRAMGNLYGSEYWTYLLPRRVGEGRAALITDRRLPMGAAEAVSAGLADARIAGDPQGFLEECVARSAALADDACWTALIEEKRRQRARDEAAKPLERYRVEELARMKLNFYGFDPSYHVARYHFVYRLPKARTPYWLAHPQRCG